jgi:hypothetical protein
MHDVTAAAAKEPHEFYYKLNHLQETVQTEHHHQSLACILSQNICYSILNLSEI